MSPSKKVRIAVMGVTGSGKSTFIQTASPLSDVGIGHELQSCTGSVSPFEFGYEGYEITLIDTPGFNDTNKSETQVLKEIADYLAFTYKNPPHLKLNGIVYLQSIMDPRMFGSSLRNLKMFKDLCGDEPLKNVILVTSKWGMAVGAGQGVLAQQREDQLATEREFWAPMVDRGSRIARFEDTRDSALQIIMSLIDQSPVVLKIQSELVDEDKNLIDTAAGNTVNEEIIRLERKYKEDLKDIQKDMDEALAAKDVEVQRALAESKEIFERKLSKIRDEQDMLQYERRNDARRMRNELEAMREEKKQWSKLLDEKLGAQQLDFDKTAQQMMANSEKLRREQVNAMQQKIDEMSNLPKKERSGKGLVLSLLPALGGLALSLVGIPLGFGPLGGFGA